MGVLAFFGDKVESVVTSKDKETGVLVLGTQHGLKAHDLSGLQDAYSQGLPVAGLVTGVTKGGVEVQIAGQRAVFRPTRPPERDAPRGTGA